MLLQQLHTLPLCWRSPHTRQSVRHPTWVGRAAEVTEAPSTSSAPDAPPLQSYIQESASYSPAELAARIGVRARLPSLRSSNRNSSYLRRAAQSSQQAAQSVMAAAEASATAANSTAAYPPAYLVEEEEQGVTSSMEESFEAMDPGQEGYEYAASDSEASDSEELPSLDLEGVVYDAAGTMFIDGEYAEYEYAYDYKAAAAAGLAKDADGQPLPESLDGLAPEAKLKALRAMHAASREMLQRELDKSLGNQQAFFSNAPQTVDMRLYQQLVATHNKQSEKIHELEKVITHMEDIIAEKNTDLANAYDLFKQIGMEYGTTGRMAQSAIAAVQYGVDPADAADKVAKLQARLATLEKGVKDLRSEFRKKVVQRVPVEWVGVATEVRVVGDFDNWTRGIELSQAQEDIMSDSVYARFEGHLLLRPGTYRVKLLVDGQWRLASDWPTEKDRQGNEVNLLTVT